MSDYTPDWTELRDCYALHMETHAGEPLHKARRDAERGIAKIKADARCEAFQDAQQIIAGDCMVDEARGRDIDRVSVGRTIREIDVEIRDSVLRIEEEA